MSRSHASAGLWGDTARPCFDLTGLWAESLGRSGVESWEWAEAAQSGRANVALRATNLQLLLKSSVLHLSYTEEKVSPD